MFLNFFWGMLCVLFGVWVGQGESRGVFERKIKENEDFWLQKRDDWHRYYTNTEPPSRTKVVPIIPSPNTQYYTNGEDSGSV